MALGVFVGIKRSIEKVQEFPAAISPPVIWKNSSPPDEVVKTELVPQEPNAGRAVTVAPERNSLILSVKVISVAEFVGSGFVIVNSKVVVPPATIGSVRKSLVIEGT